MILSIAVLSSILAGAPSASERDAVLEAERVGCLAFKNSDVAGLEHILLDDFVLTESNGQVSDKKQALSEARNKDPVDEVFENRDQIIRLYGDAAVVTGITLVKGHSAKNAFDLKFQLTDTLIRTKGKWRFASSHVSRLSK